MGFLHVVKRAQAQYICWVTSVLSNVLCLASIEQISYDCEKPRRAGRHGHGTDSFEILNDHGHGTASPCRKFFKVIRNLLYWFQYTHVLRDARDARDAHRKPNIGHYSTQGTQHNMYCARALYHRKPIKKKTQISFY